MDHDCPESDKSKEAKVQVFMHWEDKDIKMIRQRLKETITWIKCIGCERSWDNPFMMKLTLCKQNKKKKKKRAYFV